MKKFIIAAIMLLCMVNNSIYAQNVVRKGNNFTSVSTKSKASKSENKTQFTWTDSKGNTYPIYIGKSGACYVKKVSKNTGKEYNQYLGPEVSMEVCKALGRKYISRK